MLNWKNYDKLAAAEKLAALKDKVCLQEAMAGEQGAARVAAYCAPMAAGLCYNYAAKAVDEDVLAALADLAQDGYLPQTQTDTESEGLPAF